MRIKILLFITVVFCINSSILVNEVMSWDPVQSGTSRQLNDVFFINANIGWVGGDSVLLKTTNGGLNWVPQSLPVQIKIRSLYFLNENIGYIAGDWSTTYESYIYILKTNNSGNSWDIINYYHPMIFGNAYSNDVYAFDENSILKTYGEFLSYTSSGAVLKSSDGGLNFNFVLNSGVMKGLSFINSQTGWTTSESGAASPISGVYKIFKTTNQGNNWFETLTDSHPTSGPVNSRAIQFINSSTGYALGYFIKTILYKTINGGTNWFTDSLDYHSNRTMYFTDANTGWIGGYSSTGSSNIKRTTNGGINWTEQNINGTQIINKLFFVNSLTGWAVGYSGVILKTTTGGEIPTYTVSGIVKYADNSQPVTSGYVKALKLNMSNLEFETVDSTGILPDGTYSLPNVRIDSVYIRPYPNSTPIVDFIPTFYPSSINWETATKLYVNSNLTNINVGVIRINVTQSPGLISGTVFKPQNAGLNEALVYAKLNNVIKGFAISGNNGYYLINNIPAGTYNVIANRPGYYSDSTTVVATGGTMSNINFSLLSYITSVKNISAEVPEKYQLYQNYPNPFNPVTKIKFDVPMDSRLRGNDNVSLKVYDLLGREVATLVNEKLQPGTYEVKFNGSKLASGIYFYRLRTESYTETKRMTLVK